MSPLTDKIAALVVADRRLEVGKLQRQADRLQRQVNSLTEANTALRDEIQHLRDKARPQVNLERRVRTLEQQRDKWHEAAKRYRNNLLEKK